MSEDKLSDEEMAKAMSGLKEIWGNSTSLPPGFRNVIEEMARNPEQEGPDLVGEIVLLSQKIADLETAKTFHMACIENLVERLNDTGKKLKAIEQQFLEIISHGCCIPVCSKHQRTAEIKGNG